MPDSDKKPVSTAQQVANAYDALIGAAGKLINSARDLRVTVRVLIPLTIFLAILASFLEYQLLKRDDAIVRLDTNIETLRESAKETKEAAAKAQTAAESADAALKGAIANSQQQTNDSTTAINRINEIYDTCVVRKEC